MAREEGEEAFLNPQIAEFSGALACSSPCSCAAQFLCEQHWASSHSQELVLLLDDGQEVHRGIAHPELRVCRHKPEAEPAFCGFTRCNSPEKSPS